MRQTKVFPFIMRGATFTTGTDLRNRIVEKKPIRAGSAEPNCVASRPYSCINLKCCGVAPSLPGLDSPAQLVPTKVAKIHARRKYTWSGY